MSWLILFSSPILIVIFLQAILLRLFPKKSAQMLTIVSMILGIPVFEAMYFSFTHQDSTWIRSLYFFLFYCFSTYTYFHVFNMSETSRRVRLVNFVGRGVPEDRISEVFAEKQMIEVRLNRMIALGQIRKVGDRYYSAGNLFYFVALLLAGFAKLIRRPW